MNFDNISIEQLQRFALILNLIFTVLSFKIILSYRYFSKATLFIGRFEKYIFISPNRISIGVGVQKSKLEFNFIVLIIFSLITGFFIIYYPEILHNILHFPFKIMTKGVSIWQNDHQIWHYYCISFLFIYSISIWCNYYDVFMGICIYWKC